MKNKDTQLLEEAYKTILSEADHYPPKIKNGPTVKKEIAREWIINFAGKDYIYRTVANDAGSITKEELYTGIGEEAPVVSPGSNIASYPSAQKMLKQFRKLVAGSLE